MGSFAAAALAASCPESLPSALLATAAGRGCIGAETCVWLNALLGRVWRDAVSSPHFAGWLAGL